MPSYIEKDGCYFISIVTGPSHVYLGMRFADSPADTTLTRQGPLGACGHGELDETQIRDAVERALTEVRQESNARIYTSEIVYVANDTPRYELFGIAAYRLITRFLEGGPFQSVGDSPTTGPN